MFGRLERGVVNERTLRPRPTRAVVPHGRFALFALVEGLAFVANRSGSVFSLALWSIVSLTCASQLVPGAAYLKLGAAGLEVRAFFRQWSCVWTDVLTFETTRTFGSGEIVVFRLRPHLAGSVKAPAASRWLNPGWDGRLPDTYGLTAKSLADLLNDYRLKHGAAQQRDAADKARSTMEPCS